MNDEIDFGAAILEGLENASKFQEAHDNLQHFVRLINSKIPEEFGAKLFIHFAMVDVITAFNNGAVALLQREKTDVEDRKSERLLSLGNDELSKSVAKVVFNRQTGYPIRISTRLQTDTWIADDSDALEEVLRGIVSSGNFGRKLAAFKRKKGPTEDE